ncbi:hypothetical protein QSI_3207 [Clostridioides difficile P28]|nr:hypothetical protein QSI_3207 [Clostridioides difficile P28]
MYNPPFFLYTVLYTYRTCKTPKIFTNIFIFFIIDFVNMSKKALVGC